MLPDLLRNLVEMLDGSQFRFDQAAGHAHELEKRHADLLKEEAGIIGELAQLHLPELTQEVIDGSLEGLRGKLEVAIRRQSEYKLELREELEARRSRKLAAASAVDRVESLERAVAEQVTAAQERVASRLEKNEDFRRISGEHRALMERRDELKTRRGRLLSMASAERPTYEADAVFSYLKERGFDDPSVERGLLSRILDGWLARSIDFARLARNHRILKVGPHQIQAEVIKLSREAAELEVLLDEVEGEAAALDGLTAVLGEHAKAQSEVVQAREAVASAEEDLEAIAGELRATELSRGRVHAEAVQEHTAFLAQQGVEELTEIARATTDPRDDEIVTRLQTVRGWLRNVEEELGSSSSAMRHETRSVDQLGELGRALRRKFSSRRSGFSEDFAVKPKLDALLSGHTTLSEVLHEFTVAHVGEPIVAGAADPELDAWFGDLAETFEVELAGLDVLPGETTLITTDEHGRTVRRRITRRVPLVRAVVVEPDGE